MAGRSSVDGREGRSLSVLDWQADSVVGTRGGGRGGKLRGGGSTLGAREMKLKRERKRRFAAAAAALLTVWWQSGKRGGPPKGVANRGGGKQAAEGWCGHGWVRAAEQMKWRRVDCLSKEQTWAHKPLPPPLPQSTSLSYTEKRGNSLRDIQTIKEPYGNWVKL